MKHITYLLLLGSLSLSSLHAWKSPEAKGERPIIFGKIKSREGNIFYITDVSVGRSRTAQDKITLYEKPTNLISSEKGNIIPVNPSESLTTAVLELTKVKSISVPKPQTTWKWSNEKSDRAVKVVYEFIEIVVTWRSGSTVHYLLELGPENTRRPVKIFCDVIDKPLKGFRQNGTLFCPGLKKTDLRKKGAPFQSIKKLELDEPCFKVPTENNSNFQPKTNNKK